MKTAMVPVSRASAFVGSREDGNGRGRVRRSAENGSFRPNDLRTECSALKWDADKWVLNTALHSAVCKLSAIALGRPQPDHQFFACGRVGSPNRLHQSVRGRKGPKPPFIPSLTLCSRRSHTGKLSTKSLRRWRASNLTRPNRRGIWSLYMTLDGG